MNPRFAAEVSDKGELRIADPIRWRARLSRLSGKRVLVTVQREKHARSLKANAYLWGVVYEVLAEWSGHSPEEIHEAMKMTFLPRRQLTIKATGEVMDIPGSTATLDSEAFSDYVSRVKLFAAESGCHVPDPDEVEVTL